MTITATVVGGAGIGTTAWAMAADGTVKGITEHSSCMPGRVREVLPSGRTTGIADTPQRPVSGPATSVDEAT
ncbi:MULTISPECIES: hypothetical protein [Streptomyces]|uniref:hypothetical protein n=1 Tax=Streptomyces TaxID=1883 RepID=UPI0034493F38